MEAATLDEFSGGRLRLGLGASLWNLRNLGEADERTSRPLTATVEAVRIIRALLRGEPGIESTVFTVAPDAKLDFEPVRRDLPIYIGAVNKRMLRAAGAWADAIELGAIMSTGYVRWALDVIADGARSAGRDPDLLDIAAPLMVSVGADHEAARNAVREPSRLLPVSGRAGRDRACRCGPGSRSRGRAAVSERGLAAGAPR